MFLAVVSVVKMVEMTDNLIYNRTLMYQIFIATFSILGTKNSK